MAMAIHTEMLKVFGKFPLIKIMVCKQAALFKIRSTNLEQGPKSVLTSINTSENIAEIQEMVQENR